MGQPRKRWSYGVASIGVVVLLALATPLALPRVREWLPHKRSPMENLTTALVRRADLYVKMTTGGMIDSAERTLIECGLQRLEMSVKGQALAGGGSSTLLNIIPDGSTVKKGDILCVFDASDYEEMLRQQIMTVERAKADQRMAELDLEVARMAVREFKEGTLHEALKEQQGLIALYETNWERSHDRLKWARRMLEKGYVPVSQIGLEEFNERKAAFLLKQSRIELDVFQRYSAPRIIHTLESNVFAAEAQINFQDQNLKRQVEREQMLRGQVESCTIRAPHDGFVIYANDDRRQIRIEEGMLVKQGQDLLYLPDMAHMQAQAMVHETVANRVKPGMRARVRVEGLPDHVLEGHVESVAQLPSQNFFNEVRYFYTAVALDTVPTGLRPGMTAEVEIATERREQVLTIPIEALAFDEGKEFCYVADEEGVERRDIKVGQTTRDLLEVTEGLDEGEHVVLDPERLDDEIDTLAPIDTETGSTTE